MDRLRTMAAFVAVAEEQGFAPAARRLSMSAPSVTRAVSELEDRLGARLFHRTTRTVRMTEAGERYLIDCRRILSEIEEAESGAAGLHATPRGEVSITGSVLFGRIVIAPAILDFLDETPEVSVTALFVDRIAHLVDEGIDIAVRIADLPDSSLSAVRVGTVRRVLCASPDYLKERGQPKSLADLADHELINFVNLSHGGEWHFNDNGKSRAIRPKSRLNVNNADVAITAATAGRGITRVLSYQIAPQLESGDLELVLEPLAPTVIPVHVVHKEPGLTAARVRALVDFLVERLRKEPALGYEA